MKKTSIFQFAVIVLMLSASADESCWVREDELTIANDLAVRESDMVSVDLRPVFSVAKLEDEPALQGFAYSAIGWDVSPAADVTRTVTITARAGTLIDGVFTSDGSAETTVLAATTGAGMTDWHASGVSKKVYQLTHTVKKSGVVDGTATLYGYLDFSQVVSAASQTEVETAVLGEITHPIVVRQDEQSPWQPIDLAAVRSGIATDESLATGDETVTTFTFKGRGVLHFDYELTGGTLAAVAGDETVLTFADSTSGWVSGQVSFTGYGAHEVAFVYTADGGMAAIRNVRWEEQSESCRVNGEGGPVIVDLQEGVRMPKYLADVLPFEYSSTNWIGDVVSASAVSVAKVTVVKLTGTDSDVRNWTEEIPDSIRELVKKPGESSVKWKPQNGVWRATFDILNEGNCVYRETALFDLRKSRGRGLVIFLGATISSTK